MITKTSDKKLNCDSISIVYGDVDYDKDKIVDTRCLGLMAGIEFKTNEIASKTYTNIVNNGLITTLIQGNIIRITPPLIINKKELKHLGV